MAAAHPCALNPVAREVSCDSCGFDSQLMVHALDPDRQLADCNELRRVRPGYSCCRRTVCNKKPVPPNKSYRQRVANCGTEGSHSRQCCECRSGRQATRQSPRLYGSPSPWARFKPQCCGWRLTLRQARLLLPPQKARRPAAKQRPRTGQHQATSRHLYPAVLFVACCLCPRSCACRPSMRLCPDSTLLVAAKAGKPCGTSGGDRQGRHHSRAQHRPAEPVWR